MAGEPVGLRITDEERVIACRVAVMRAGEAQIIAGCKQMRAIGSIYIAEL